jgi:hypothetical protein
MLLHTSLPCYQFTTTFILSCVTSSHRYLPECDTLCRSAIPNTKEIPYQIGSYLLTGHKAESVIHLTRRTPIQIPMPLPPYLLLKTSEFGLFLGVLYRTVAKMGVFGQILGSTLPKGGTTCTKMFMVLWEA